MSYKWTLIGAILIFGTLTVSLCSLDVTNTSGPILAENITIFLALILVFVISCTALIDNELSNRKISTFVSGLGQSNKSASVLDTLPDGIIIADSNQINYLNHEALKLLGCQATSDECTNIEDIFCLDVKNCSILTPLEQLINFLTAVDHRIADVNKDCFLSDMIQMATDDAVLLQMHQGLASPCDDIEVIENEGQGAATGKDEKPEELAEGGEGEQNSVNQGPEGQNINGVYYDVRIKTHYWGTQRQVVFVFTNVSAEKELQRELVMKQYM